MEVEPFAYSPIAGELRPSVMRAANAVACARR